MRTMVATCFLLLAAFIIERGMLPQIVDLLPYPWGAMIDWRLLAVAGIVLGLLAGESVGLLGAILAALLFGLSQAPGYLGASLVSFPMAAWLAGQLARHFRFQSVSFSFFWLLLLLLVERLVWMLVRWFFFRNTPFLLNWPQLTALLITAVLGAIAIGVIAPHLRRGMFDDD